MHIGIGHALPNRFALACSKRDLDSQILQRLSVSKGLVCHLDRHSFLASRCAQRPSHDGPNRNDDSTDGDDPRSISQYLSLASSLWIVLDGKSMEDPY